MRGKKWKAVFGKDCGDAMHAYREQRDRLADLLERALAAASPSLIGTWSDEARAELDALRVEEKPESVDPHCYIHGDKLHVGGNEGCMCSCGRKPKTVLMWDMDKDERLGNHEKSLLRGLMNNDYGLARSIDALSERLEAHLDDA